MPLSTLRPPPRDGAVALAAWALRRNSPRARYWLWMTASVKFLIPFSWIVFTGTRVQLPPDTPSLHAVTVNRISSAFAPVPVRPAAVPLKTTFQWTLVLVVDGGRAKQRVVEVKACDPEAVRLEVAGGGACGALRDGLDGDRPPGPVAESFLLGADQRADRDGWRFQELAIRRAQPASRASVGSLRSRLGKAVVFSVTVAPMGPSRRV